MRAECRAFERAQAALAAGALALAISPNAAAQAPPLPIVVERAPAASDCVDATSLADRVTILTGRKALVPFEGERGDASLVVEILKTEEGYIATISSAGKSRKIEDPGPTCESLSEALSLTLAILVDTDAPSPPRPPPIMSELPTQTLLPPIALPSSPRPAPTPPAAPTIPRFFLSPIVALTEGLSGSLVPALGVSGEVHVLGPFSVRAGFDWMPGQSFARAPGRVDVQLTYGQIAPCLSTWNLLSRRVRLGGCVQVNVGGLRGQAFGYAQNREVTRIWTSMGLTALLDIPVVGPFYLPLRLTGLINVPQEAFAIDGLGTVFDPPPAGVLVGTGVGVTMF